MKHIKRLLCAMLCLVLLLGMGVFARAEEAADPYAPVITMHPHGSLVKVGDTITLEAQARLYGEGELSYAWYDAEHPDQPVSTSQKAEIVTSIDDLTAFFVEKVYYVIVTNTYTDAENQIQTASTESYPTTVWIYPSIGQALVFLWGGSWIVSMPAISKPFGVIMLSPLLLLYSLFYLCLYPILANQS